LIPLRCGPALSPSLGTPLHSRHPKIPFPVAEIRGLVPHAGEGGFQHPRSGTRPSLHLHSVITIRTRHHFLISSLTRHHHHSLVIVHHPGLHQHLDCCWYSDHPTDLDPQRPPCRGRLAPETPSHSRVHPWRSAQHTQTHTHNGDLSKSSVQLPRPHARALFRLLMSAKDDPHTPPHGLIPPRDPNASPPPAPARRVRPSRPRPCPQHRSGGPAATGLPEDDTSAAADVSAASAAAAHATAAAATPATAACRACGRASPLRYRGLCWSLDCALRAAGALASDSDSSSPDPPGENNENQLTLQQQERDAATPPCPDDEQSIAPENRRRGCSSSGGGSRSETPHDAEADCSSDGGIGRGNQFIHSSHQKHGGGLQRLQSSPCETRASLSHPRPDHDKKGRSTDGEDGKRGDNNTTDDDILEHSGPHHIFSDPSNVEQRRSDWDRHDVERSSVQSQGVSAAEGHDGTDQGGGECMSLLSAHPAPAQGKPGQIVSAATPAAPPPSPSSPSTTVEDAVKSEPGDERAGVWADAVCAVRAGTTELCSLLGLRIPT
jgi:hypothetical protein